MSFYRRERVSLLHAQLRDSSEQLERPFAVIPTNCNPNDLQPWRDVSYGEDALDIIRNCPIEFKHLDRGEGPEKLEQHRVFAKSLEGHPSVQVGFDVNDAHSQVLQRVEAQVTPNEL